MKNKYLFIDRNNGHGNTYHPFVTEAVLTQEKVDEMTNSRFAGRVGATITTLFHALDERGIKFDFWECECCGTLVTEIKNPKLHEWECIHGICGNY